MSLWKAETGLPPPIVTSTRITSTGRAYSFLATAHFLKSSFVAAAPTLHNLFPPDVTSLSSIVFNSGTLMPV